MHNEHDASSCRSASQLCVASLSPSPSHKMNEYFGGINAFQIAAFQGCFVSFCLKYLYALDVPSPLMLDHPAMCWISASDEPNVVTNLLRVLASSRRSGESPFFVCQSQTETPLR
ncbi:hypothetical protein Salat_1413800 [Sesamum alatum]|uniref:Uncharacterized protein n=1 Tax=Sesamum alatum TaxID=300844 RepID=A0AAE2CLD8_9LAMI|nr:hypothetical protein Salat_1413800 [Sesamum alatum]